MPYLFTKEKKAMLLTIRYSDSKNNHKIVCDKIQSDAIRRVMKSLMIIPLEFDFMHIDLSDESCEKVTCCQSEKTISRDGNPTLRDVCRFGGAAAWEIYKMTAEVWPQIGYYITNNNAAHKPPLCALTLEQVKADPYPLMLLREFPYKQQWLDKYAWAWLQYILATSNSEQHFDSNNIAQA